MPWKFEQEGVKRNISPSEFALINRLLSTPFPGSAELRMQLASPDLRVTSMGEIIRINFVTRPSGYAKTKYQVPIEASSNDLDGMEMSVMLHVVEGLLYELEVYRVDGEGISRMPTPESLHDFFVAGEPF